jgi:hypothetical protein
MRKLNVVSMAGLVRLAWKASISHAQENPKV